ncbi:MAG TPA: DUF2007-related protein, partial [Sphingobacteriaceae bacterium]
EHNIVPVEIFSGSLWEAEVVQGMLNSEGIETFVRDDQTGTIAPWVVVSGGVDSVRLMVAETEAARARQIISEYREE